MAGTAATSSSANGGDDDGSATTRGKRRWFWQKKRRNKNKPSKAGGVVEEPSLSKRQTVVISNTTTSKQQQQNASGGSTSTTTGSSSSPMVTLVPERVQPADTSQTTTSKNTRRASSSSTRKAGGGASWLCRTRRFQKLCDSAFESIDTDGSGQVDRTELYAGLLLIHLNLGMYCGPAACKPLSRERANAIFTLHDVDDSGTLDKEEFSAVMMVLFGNVLFRVAVQWACTILLVPLVARQLWEWIGLLRKYLVHVITTLDEHWVVADWIELSLEGGVEFVVSRCLPSSLLLVLAELGDMLQAVPASVWSALPLTILSTILGIVVVPWIIFKIDDLFHWIAHRNIDKQEAVKAPSNGATPR